jgi:hypothetical protein
VPGSPDEFPDLTNGTPFQLSDVSPVTDEDMAYIIEGDGRGNGGHGHGRGIEGKTEFPARWDADKIRAAVESVLWGGNPSRITPSLRGVTIRALYDGVVIEVPVRRIGNTWELSTAYPVSGEGVYRNVAGNPLPVPLNINDIAY